jgi:imidazolonepropionase-like amidohydrolase
VSPGRVVDEGRALFDDAETAVDEQLRFGASVIKVAMNASAGPVFDRSTLDAIVRAARVRGLPVAAHAEGPGMPELAIEAGVDVLVHTPWTEELPSEVIARAARSGQRWISTLDIHGHGAATAASTCATANLSRFHAAGGRVLYGTDLGNGELPVGVNAEEVAALDRAGVRGEALIDAMADPWPATAAPSGISTFVPGPPPTVLDEVAAWIAGATVVPTEELVHDEH